MKNIISNLVNKINIKLFDSSNLNTQTTSSEGLSDEMKTYYSDFLIDLVEPRLVHDQFADKHNIPKGNGKTIEFRKYSPLGKALTPITEGVTPKGNSLNMSTITAEIYQYGDYIVLSDILQLAAIDNNVVQATKLLGSQAGRTLDTVTREVMAGGTNVYYAPAVAADGTETAVNGRHLLTKDNKFTPDCAFRAKTALAAQNAAPIDDCYVAIIHPYCSYDIMRNKEWIDVSKYAEKDNYYKGEIGKIGGVRFVESTEAKIFRGADLASNSRTLKIASVSGSTVTFNGGTVEAGSLEGRFVLIGAGKYEVVSNTASAMVLDETPATTTAGTVIYPGEGGKEGCAVFAVTVIAQNAYGTTALEGGGLEHIVKPLGSGGTSDPLNQRSSVGWKATKAAERLVENYMYRVECGSTYSATAQAN